MTPQGAEGDTNGAGSAGVPQGLYDKPLVVEGKRRRKSIEQFSVSSEPKKPKAKVGSNKQTVVPNAITLYQMYVCGCNR